MAPGSKARARLQPGSAAGAGDRGAGGWRARRGGARAQRSAAQPTLKAASGRRTCRPRFGRGDPSTRSGCCSWTTWSHGRDVVGLRRRAGRRRRQTHPRPGVCAGPLLESARQHAVRLGAPSGPATRSRLLRDVDTEPKKFRELVRELSMLLCYEATRDLELVDRAGHHADGHRRRGQRLRTKIGLMPILRAGLGMVEGVLEMIPTAEVWHIGLYRDERTLHPVEYYNRLPTPNRVQLSIVLDPMLATGGTAEASVDILKRWGCERIKYIGLLAAPEGIAAPEPGPPGRADPRRRRRRAAERDRLHRARTGRRRATASSELRSVERPVTLPSTCRYRGRAGQRSWSSRTMPLWRAR